MNVRLHIERLILDGLPVEAAQAPTVQAAVEAELARLLAEAGPDFLQGGAFAYARGPEIPLASGPEGVGRDIAASIQGSLHR